jgi:hypothetical protein
VRLGKSAERSPPALPEVTALKIDEQRARAYADRLILEQLTELRQVVKPSEISDRLKDKGLTLGAVRSLLAANPDKFAYHERRWVPAARLATEGGPIIQVMREAVRRFSGPMPIELLAAETPAPQGLDGPERLAYLRRLIVSDADLILTRSDAVIHKSITFAAKDESIESAFAANGVSHEDLEPVHKALGPDFDWLQEDALMIALETAAPVSAKALGAAAWLALNPQDPFQSHFFDYQAFAGELFAIPGFIFDGFGGIHPEKDAVVWVQAALRASEKVEAEIEVEDVAPLSLSPEDAEAMVQRVLAAEGSSRAIQILEEQFEITTQVKTFPDDLAIVMESLRADSRIVWVGGDRFQVPGQAPDFILETPEPFRYTRSQIKDQEGHLIDIELADEGLSSSLRKLMNHPLAMDVLDEDPMPALGADQAQVRCVLKPIHRELGTFPLSQFPTGWFQTEPKIQELIFVGADGQELQVWMNNGERLLFNLFEWWLEQPVESGAVFSLNRTRRPNVFEFAWEEQTDPVVYISTQRMEELRDIAGSMADSSTFDLLQEVMKHWPKGADFLTILWEINVVRRTSRRLLASLLSSYVCFYQRSGSPVWHYDHKKVEQGFDKGKRKFVRD